MHSDSLIGQVVDSRYTITQRVGRGGMATVYRAHDARLDRDVALKVMHPHLAEQAGFVERFNREARTAARLTSPYVVAVHDQGVWDSPNGPQAFLIMEYVGGPDVRSELSRLGSFNLGTALEIAEQTLQALAAAHRAGLVHRDVKPENVLLTSPLPPVSVFERPEIHAKVADFGLARAVSATTTASTVMGTIAYVAPEVVTHSKAEAPSDIYAVGIMLYEFLTGKLPFQAPTPIATAYQHINTPMPRVSEVAEWLPPAVDSLIAVLTAKDPSARPQNGAEALAEIRTIIGAIPEEDLVRRVPVIPARGSSGTPTRRMSDSPVDSTGMESPTAHGLNPPTAAPHTPAAERPDPRFPSKTIMAAYPPAQTTHVLQQPTTPASSSTARKRRSRTPDPLLPAKNSTPQNVGAHNGAVARQKKRRRKAPLLIALLLVIAVASSAGWYFLMGPGKRIEVPSVAGMTFSEAQKKLDDAGFAATRNEEHSDDIAKDTVISTTPHAGERANPAEPVVVTISLGILQVPVPDVSGQTADEAKKTLDDSQLTMAEDEEWSETVAKGQAIRQDIAAGTSVNHDSTVTVTFSKGREPIAVPEVAGSTKDDAVAAIEALGLVADVQEEFSDTVAEGTVISQDPTSGTLYKGNKVTITVSKGPELVQVPSVIGMSKSQAIATLKDAGFEVKTENALWITLGLVHSQTPKAGDMAPRGSTITISLV